MKHEAPGVVHGDVSGDVHGGAVYRMAKFVMILMAILMVVGMASLPPLANRATTLNHPISSSTARTPSASNRTTLYIYAPTPQAPELWAPEP